MTNAEERRNWNRPDAERRPAERMNEADEGPKGALARADFQDHLTKRANASRGKGERPGTSVIDRDRFARRPESVAIAQPQQGVTGAESAVRMSEGSADQGVLDALSEASEQGPPRMEEEIVSPDVSLEHPHGPEGASHGGRGGRDPVQYVEDSTATETNAHSRIRGVPEKRTSAQR